MENGNESRAVTEGALFVWASVGTSDSPPERLQAELCVDCGALIAVATMDQHGMHHAALERLARLATATEQS